jgi:DMSO/TMAO reductase YedYZ molybdopterin-dependent catalytic subunit
LNALFRRLGRWRDDRLERGSHSDRTAALLGVALGLSFLVCFLTGLYSHLLQQPPAWFNPPTRPAGLYRITQGLHVATGIATVPLLLTKLWSVFPRLFRWPLADDVLHGVERLSLLPLVGGALFMTASGMANIQLWYPWPFFFPAAHYAVAYVTMGALVIHLVAKFTVTRRALATAGPPDAGASDRRRFLRTVAGLSAGITVLTVGQTVSPLRRWSLLAPRRPDIGPQGFPVNKSAREAGVTDAIDASTFTLIIEHDGTQLTALTLADLQSIAQRTATLPIACVEGWSTNQRWTGVSVGDLLALVGMQGRGVRVESLQRGGRYRRSELTVDQAADLDTLLALQVNGEPLHPDHGFPVRLIGPGRPGVLQTKWVDRLVVG